MISTKYALTWKHAVLVAWFGLSFTVINHMPVSLQSVWQQAVQGEWILANSSVPNALPYAPLADGMPFVATSWLSDTALAGGLRFCGLEFLSAATAVLTTLTIGIWCWLCYRHARQKRYALFVAVCLTVAWSFGLATMRPQLFAGLLFPVLIWNVWPVQMTNARRVSPDSDSRGSYAGPSNKAWLGTLAIMALWANLDVSLFLGVATLMCLVVRQVTHACQRGGVTSVVRDRHTQRSVLVAESAILATLVTPHGWAVWQSVFRTEGRGPIWSVAGGDFGLRLATTTGLVFGLLVAFLMAAWLMSQLAKRAHEVCLLVAVVVATALNPTNIFWLAPVVLFLASAHWRNIAEQRGWSRPAAKDPENVEYHPLLFAWSLLCPLMIWCSFAFAPISNPILSAESRPTERILDKQVPLDVGRFLNSKSSPGIVWAPSDWSDWILWSGKRETQVFVHSPLHLFPTTVQRDYVRVFRGDAAWDEITKRYNVGTLVLDKQRQAKLASDVVRSARWRLVYETDQTMVLFLNEA